MRTVVATIVTRCIAGAGGVAVRGLTSLDPERYQRILIAGSGAEQLDAARDAGIEVLLVPDLVSPISPHGDVAALRHLLTMLREREVDVVHTHSAKAGALGRAAAHRARVPRVVHTLHGFPFHDFQRRTTRATYIGIERRLARWTDTLLAVGTEVAVEAIRLRIAQPNQIRTIGPAVQPSTIRASASTRAAARLLLGLPASARVVGAVGRLDYQKDPRTMIDALARTDPDVELVWVGDGPDLASIRELVSRRGLAHRVHLLGHRTDVDEILPAFDVFAMSSRYEGLPCAIVEAQMCGIPVVATTVNAVSDLVVPGESGLLVPPQRPDLLARALSHALTHRELADRWADAARQALGRRYEPETLGVVLDEVYSGADRTAVSLAPHGAA